jgi:endonuclease/exonuclease/phosphatase family metal-dependent hydrolase
MKGISCILILLLLGIATAQGQSYTTKFATLNIRWDSPNDGKNIWQKRRQDVAGFLSFHSPDVMGFQEAMPHQVSYLDSALYYYSWVGESRDGGLKSGELSPIFYKKESFELMDSGIILLICHCQKTRIYWKTLLHGNGLWCWA